MFIIIILSGSVPSRGENGCRRSLTCLKASCQRAPDSLVSNPGNEFSWLKPAGASFGHSEASFLECSWKRNHRLCGPSGSASFAQHHEFESHPNCCVDQEFILIF